MPDIVERLRQWANENWQAKIATDVLEAADQIERLRSNHAVIVARRDVRYTALEEAARVAETAVSNRQMYANDIPPAIAAAIRNLKQETA